MAGNGPHSIEYYLHENKCKLIALSVYAEKCLNMLLCDESLNFPYCIANKITDPNEAFEAVLKFSSAIGGDIKKWQDIVEPLKHEDNKKVWFDTSNGNTWEINSTICTESMDMNLVIKLLLKIPEFTCSYKSSKNLLRCTSCKKKKKSCCVRCECCEKCKPNRGIKCKSSMLVSIIKDLSLLRNAIAHPTVRDMVDIEDDKPIGDKYVKFMEKLKKHKRSIENLLEILQHRGQITSTEYTDWCCQLKSVLNDTKEIYFCRISQQVVFDSLQFKAKFKCTSTKNIDELKDYESDKYKAVFKGVEKTIIDHLKTEILNINTSGWFDVSFTEINSSSETTTTENTAINIKLKFRIVGEKKNSIPDCLKDIVSKEVGSFRKCMTTFILEEVKKVFESDDIKCESVGYGIGSIKMIFELSPTTTQWSFSDAENYAKKVEAHFNCSQSSTNILKELSRHGFVNFNVTVIAKEITNNTKFTVSVSTCDENLLNFLEEEKAKLIEISEEFFNDFVEQHTIKDVLCKETSNYRDKDGDNDGVVGADRENDGNKITNATETIDKHEEDIVVDSCTVVKKIDEDDGDDVVDEDNDNNKTSNVINRTTDQPFQSSAIMKNLPTRLELLKITKIRVQRSKMMGDRRTLMMTDRLSINTKKDKDGGDDGVVGADKDNYDNKTKIISSDFDSYSEADIKQLILNEDIKKLKSISSQWPNVVVKSLDNKTPLHYASLIGRADIVKILIDSGANVHVVDKYKHTPLHYASYFGRADIVKILIDSGANVHVVDSDNRTPLHDASWNGYADIVKILIDSGANVHVVDSDNQTPLHYASLIGRADIVEILKKHGAVL